MSTGISSDIAWRGTTALPVSMVVHTAHTPCHQLRAHALVGRRYAERGYRFSAPTPAQMPSQAPAGNLVTVNAGDQHSTLGTLTVRFDSAQGLQADEVFGLEIEALRKAGRKVCEFTKLALEGELPSQQILAALFHMAYIHAHLIRGFDILAVEVNPRHAGYYRRMLGFKVCSPERTNLRVQAPAVLLCVEFEHIRAQIARFGGRPELAGQVRTLYPMAFGAQEEARLVHQLRAAAGQN